MTTKVTSNKGNKGNEGEHDEGAEATTQDESPQENEAAAAAAAVATAISLPHPDNAYDSAFESDHGSDKFWDSLLAENHVFLVVF